MRKSALPLLLAMVLAFPVRGVGLPELAIEQFTLDNGLRVILHQDRSYPTAAVSLWYGVGSGNEEPGKTGLAHLCEHMMFQGSLHHDEDYFGPLQDIGGTVNANTNRDRTVFWETVPPEYLERALWLEADRMGGLVPAMTQAKLDNQLGVVRNELAQRRGEPYAGVGDRLLELLYPAEHPYSRPVTGSLEDLAAVGLDDIAEFLAAHYVPGNATLCIAGDFDGDQVRGWIGRYFGPLPARPAADPPESGMPAGPGPRRERIHTGSVAPRLVMGWRTPGWYQPGDAEFDLLADILGRGKASRLQRLLVHEKGLAQEVRVSQDSRLLGGVFTITVTAVPGGDLAQIEAVVDQELRSLLEEGLTPEEVGRAVTRRQADFLRRLENLGGTKGRAELLNGYAFYAGGPDYLEKDMTRYLDATAGGILAWAGRHLQEAGQAVLHMVPEPPAKSPSQAAWAEDGPGGGLPGGSSPHPYQPPEIEGAVLANGLRIQLVRRAGLPMVEAHLTILGGWASDPADRPGAASLTAAMLDEGAGSLDAMAIASAVEEMGAELRTSTGFDGITVALNMLTSSLDRGLALLADLVIRPTFPAEEFDRLKALYGGRQQREAAKPDSRGIIELQRRLFSPDHPYRQPYTGSGTAESLAALTVADLAVFHQNWYRPRNAVLVLVGDLTLPEALASLEGAFGNWPDQGIPALRPAGGVTPPGPRLVVIDRPAAEQTSIFGGLCLPARNHPDYRPLQVVNSILGGQYSSRVNLNLRKTMGVTYGARTRLIGFKDTGLFLVTAPVETGRAAEALTALAAEMGGLQGDGAVTAQELAVAKERMIQGFPRDFRSLGATAEALDHLLINGVELEGWGGYVDQIDRLRIEDLDRVAKEYLQPDRMVWVLVGPYKDLKEQLVAAGWGGAEVVE